MFLIVRGRSKATIYHRWLSNVATPPAAAPTPPPPKVGEIRIPRSLSRVMSGSVQVNLERRDALEKKLSASQAGKLSELEFCRVVELTQCRKRE